MPHPAITPPCLTSELPGIGGRIKVEVADFQVEEVPAYEPSGVGEHIYLWIEKIDLGPEFFAKRIAQALGIAPMNVGMAGLKDRRGITRQWVSVPAACEALLGKIDAADIRVLKTARHGNKLKPGHLRGNRFIIVVRDADPTKADAAEAILSRIRTEGMPNYYGPQRFGNDGTTADVGLECLAGRRPRGMNSFRFKFALSAVQSLLFNDYLARRLRDGLLRTVLAGDVMMKRPAGGLFNAEDVPTEQTRFEAGETVPGGPMYGSRMYPTRYLAAEREAQVLFAHALRIEDFDHFGKLVNGTRRHTLVFPDDLIHTWEGPTLTMAFTLSSGCYATVLLHELMKSKTPEVVEEPVGEEAVDSD